MKVINTFSLKMILAVGLYHSFKKPDIDHPYGYRNLRHISSLISGVGIFFLGTGVTWYHGVQGFMQPVELTSLGWVRIRSKLLC